MQRPLIEQDAIAPLVGWVKADDGGVDVEEVGVA